MIQLLLLQALETAPGSTAASLSTAWASRSGGSNPDPRPTAKS
ncbi:hypothetical protein [Streptomyces humicola]|nr:hypothetical protein [Streptomyces humicola]